MSLRDLKRRMLLTIQFFAVLRFAEALFATVAGELTAFVTALFVGRRPYPRLEWGDFQGAWMVSQTYYLSFGYLCFSAIAFFLSGLVLELNSRRKLLVTNLGAFVVHSLAVIGLIFSGKIDIFLWIVWFQVVIFNWVMPFLVWRWRLGGISDSATTNRPILPGRR